MPLYHELTPKEQAEWGEPSDFDEAAWRAKQDPEWLIYFDANNKKNADWLDKICVLEGFTREQWSALPLGTRYGFIGKYLALEDNLH